MSKIDPATGMPALTDRESQILELISCGLSAKEIAQEINIAPRTVERHIENIRLKIRARNRPHMVACAISMGLLETPDPDSENLSSRWVA